jgi:hypothetical protein
MAKRNTPNTSGGQTTDGAPRSASNGDSAEDRFIALAEQLGRIVGTIRAKADGWLDRDALTQQLTQVRDGATHLLEQIGVSGSAGEQSGRDNGEQPAASNTDTGRQSGTASRQQNSRRAAKGGRAETAEGSGTGRQNNPLTMRGRSGGVVDAPGKKHRKPVPNQVRANAADGGRVAKMKAVNANRRRGR